MPVRQRVISALVVFGVGFAAALPFLRNSTPPESRATAAPDVGPPASPPSVALRIPVEEPPPQVSTDPPAPPAARQAEPRPIASEALLKVEPQLPTISSEFPRGNPIVPPNAEAASGIVSQQTLGSESSGEKAKSGPRVYRIRDGDTLRRIAHTYLNDPDRWREIFELNQKVIADPELLPIGKDIVIPERVSTGRPGGPSATTGIGQAAAAVDPPLTTLVPIQ